MYKLLFKRLLDLVLATIGLVVLSPLFILVTMLLTIANEGKPFFFQKRPGRYGEVFSIVKFKTMNDKIDENGDLLPDVKRLTKVGKFVRKTSIDELPQLFNVIIGEMSLIGPRPLLIEYLSIYTQEENRRHDVKPGITGWAQINGRNAISWKQKFIYDVWYVDNVSFLVDAEIFFKTILKVLKAKDINTQGQATTEPFNGNN